jgi:hypothetical protein
MAGYFAREFDEQPANNTLMHAVAETTLALNGAAQSKNVVDSPP